MKSQHHKNLAARLNRIKEELGVLTQPESRAAFLKSLDDLIASLNCLRNELANPSLEAKIGDIRTPLEQVIGFLERAKYDETLQTMLSLAGITIIPKPKRKPIAIANNLTNEAIRAVLAKDLSKAELKAIAAQRSISVGESTNDEIRRSILKNLERQEGYGRLASP
jgi:hypothetical protein